MNTQKRIIIFILIIFIFLSNVTVAFAAPTTKRFYTGANTTPLIVSPVDYIYLNKTLPKYENEIKIIAKVLYRESRGASDTQNAAVAWCILNRVDHKNYGNTITKVATARHQFAYKKSTPITKRLYNIAKDVVARWLLEKRGYTSIGRVLPKDYKFFSSTGKGNKFRKEYRSKSYYKWTLKSPYRD